MSEIKVLFCTPTGCTSSKTVYPGSPCTLLICSNDIIKRRNDASFLPLQISWTCSFVCLLVWMLLTETSKSLKVWIFWTFFYLSGDISSNMAWSMNSDHVHHDNLPCPMNSPFPLFPFLALKQRKSTFSMGKSRQRTTLAVLFTFSMFIKAYMTVLMYTKLY